MTTSTSPVLRSRLQLALLNSRQKQKSLLQKGFTLVELMIVIVIVGILSAIALPNFLSQKDKAYMTEAKQNNSAYLKQWYAASLESTDAATAMEADAPTGACPIDTDNFAYTCESGTITAAGQGSMAGKDLTMTVDDNGKIETGAASG